MAPSKRLLTWIIREGIGLKVKIVKKNDRRVISKDIEQELTSISESMLTPFWEAGEVFLKREKKYDVSQAWMNNILKKLLVENEYKDEVDPFSHDRPETIEKRLTVTKKESNKQAIDFEKTCSKGKRHVIEVECGNVGSLYRSIHKICMSMRERTDTIGILFVPKKELISRCDVPSSMSNSESAKVILSEWAYYHPEASQINIIEFSSDEEVNIAELNNNPGFWKGNWSNDMQKYLDENLHRFVKPIIE